MKRITLVILAAVLCNFACRARSESPSPEKPASLAQNSSGRDSTYHGAGVIKSMDVGRPSIEIDHEDIKDLMPAMTMDFYVKDASLLNGLQPGDKIEFTMVNGRGGLKITEIKKR